MKKEQIIISNYGILTSISWNSNKWAGAASKVDCEKSNYDYVKGNGRMNESLNFGHEDLPPNGDGYYIGSTPMFNRPPSSQNSKNVEIVFFISSDYKNLNQKTIIGFYGHPTFGEWYERTAKHKLFEGYNKGNIKALPNNIIYFENPIIIDNVMAQEKNLLPPGKKISQQGFNYLNSDNVGNLINIALQRNLTNKKLKRFVDNFPLTIKLAKEKNDVQDFIEVIGNSSADDVAGIQELEKKIKKQLPEIKQRISTFIERGSIANKIKKMTGYKCLICEAMGMHHQTFIKPNGKHYIETHHVEPVSSMKVGVLGIGNLLTLCANHHRQLHYGNSILLEQTAKYFMFKIDEKTIKINKIIIV